MRLTAFAMYLRTTGLTSRHLDRVQHGPAQQEPVKHKLFAEAARPPFFPVSVSSLSAFSSSLPSTVVDDQLAKNTNVALIWTESRAQSPAPLSEPHAYYFSPFPPLSSAQQREPVLPEI